MTSDRWLILFVVLAGLVSTAALGIRIDTLTRQIGVIEASQCHHLPPPIRRPAGDPA